MGIRTYVGKGRGGEVGGVKVRGCDECDGCEEGSTVRQPCYKCAAHCNFHSLC